MHELPNFGKWKLIKLISSLEKASLFCCILIGKQWILFLLILILTPILRCQVPSTINSLKMSYSKYKTYSKKFYHLCDLEINSSRFLSVFLKAIGFFFHNVAYTWKDSSNTNFHDEGEKGWEISLQSIGYTYREYSATYFVIFHFEVRNSFFQFSLSLFERERVREFYEFSTSTANFNSTVNEYQAKKLIQ